MTAIGNKNRMTSPPIVASSGDKGGLGKSLVMRCLAHALVRWDVAWQGFDGDARNSHLARFYSKNANIDVIPQKTAADFDKLLDKIEAADPTKTILIDFPAGAGELMVERGHRLTTLANHLGRPLYRLFAIDEEDDCLLAIHREAPTLGLANIIAVLNGRFGPPEAFTLWGRKLKDGSPSMQDRVLGAGGRELYIPGLPAVPRMEIRDARCAFHDAEKALGNLSFNERLNYEEWLAEIEDAFLSLKELF